jgi:hypothetical protein
MDGYTESCKGVPVRVAGDAAAVLQLRQQLSVLAAEFSDRPVEFADAVMGVLSGFGVVEPAVSSPPLLSAQGTALCELAVTPSATLRELSVRLGWSEGYVQKVVTQLATSGFLSRTRVGQRVTYRIARETVLRHADSRRLAAMWATLAATVPVEVLDSTV